MSGPDSVGHAVIGAGPAGITAAHVLGRRGARGIVYEAESQIGGIAKTIEYGGSRFDLGPHRFFTRIVPIQRLWQATLGDEFLLRLRLTRIHYDGRLFAYPLKVGDVVRRLGPAELARCGGSLLAARLSFGKRAPDSFEAWTVRRFGRRLSDTFFRTYTEKVWGIPGSQIEPEWAAQRIKNLSAWQALIQALHLRRGHVTSLIEEFHYPRYGPGQMWEALCREVEEAGIPVLTHHRVTALEHRGGRVTALRVETPARSERRPVSGVVSSMPLSQLVLSLHPAPPEDVLAAARRLRYRDMVVVGLVSSGPQPFPDNWIYVHDPGVSVGRVQNYGAWSDCMTRFGATSLGAEYFCFEGDERWSASDRELAELAAGELESIGLLDASQVEDSVVFRVPRAYPMYDLGYRSAVGTLRGYLSSFSNLQTCGRNGLHRYNNQDHSMWTATLATLNLLDDAGLDVWAVGAEAEYQERGRISQSALEESLVGGYPEPGEVSPPAPAKVPVL